MSDTAIQLPYPIVLAVEGVGADGPLQVVVATTDQNGLQVQVADVRALAPDAFPPRTVADRVVTDTASFTAEIGRRPLVAGVSTVWGDRPAGRVTVIYDELAGDAADDFTRRSDRLVLQFVPDPDWATTPATQTFR